MVMTYGLLFKREILNVMFLSLIDNDHPHYPKSYMTFLKDMSVKILQVNLMYFLTVTKYIPMLDMYHENVK